MKSLSMLEGAMDCGAYSAPLPNVAPIIKTTSKSVNKTTSNKWVWYLVIAIIILVIIYIVLNDNKPINIKTIDSAQDKEQEIK